MAIFQSQGEGGGQLQLELELAIFSFLFEQEKVPALSVNSHSWGYYSHFAWELKRDYDAFLRYQEDRCWELHCAGIPREDWPSHWSYDRDWRPCNCCWF